MPLVLETGKGWQALGQESKAKKGVRLPALPDSQTSTIIKMNNEEVKAIADLVTANTIFCTKDVLTSIEAAKYMGVSLSYLYKLTMRQEIPHYKPSGKMVYFNRQELEQWLQKNRVMSVSEAKDLATTNNGRAYYGK